MKKYDYNIVMVDTQDMADVLSTLIKYGRQGWRFVGWTEMESKRGFIRGAILEKEIENE